MVWGHHCHDVFLCCVRFRCACVPVCGEDLQMLRFAALAHIDYPPVPLSRDDRTDTNAHIPATLANAALLAACVSDEQFFERTIQLCRSDINGTFPSPLSCLVAHILVALCVIVLGVRMCLEAYDLSHAPLAYRNNLHHVLASLSHSGPSSIVRALKKVCSLCVHLLPRERAYSHCSSWSHA